MEDLYCSQNRVDVLKKRAKRCVCKYCGQPLSIKRIMFNQFEDARIEIYCDHCQRIEFGIEPEIYHSAKNFVDNLAFNYYTDAAQNTKTYHMNIAKVCEIMAWGYKNNGLLDENGFTVSLDKNTKKMDKCLIITENDLAD